MSEPSETQRANLDLTRRAFGAFNSGSVEGVLESADEDVEVYMPSDLPNSGTFRGHDGYRTWVTQWLEAWDDFAVEPREMEAVGKHHVVTSAHQSAKGKGSGIPVEMDIAYMTSVRGGKFVALHLYRTRDEAVEVAERREAGEPDASG